MEAQLEKIRIECIAIKARLEDNEPISFNEDCILLLQSKVEKQQKELELSADIGLKIANELQEFKTYIRNRASGLNQSNEFSYQGFYNEVVKWSALITLMIGSISLALVLPSIIIQILFWE